MAQASSDVLKPSEIAYLVLQYWGGGVFNGQNTTAMIMVAIAMAESGGNTKAHNPKPPDDSYGLWQINMIGGLGPARRAQYHLESNEDLYSAATNARVAHGIWQKSGFGAWSTYSNGKFKQFQAVAEAGVKNPQKPGNIGGGPDQTEREGIDDRLYNALIKPVIDFFKLAGIRLAGFIGGSALIIMAIVLVAKRGIK